MEYQYAVLFVFLLRLLCSLRVVIQLSLPYIASHTKPPILVGEVSIRTEGSSPCDVGEVSFRTEGIAKRWELAWRIAKTEGFNRRPFARCQRSLSHSTKMICLRICSQVLQAEGTYIHNYCAFPYCKGLCRQSS